MLPPNLSPLGLIDLPSLKLVLIHFSHGLGQLLLAGGLYGLLHTLFRSYSE